MSIASKSERLKNLKVRCWKMQIKDEEIRERVINLVKTMLSLEIGLPIEKIDSRVALENYGMNSIMLIKFTNRLEEKFGALSKTVLFEYGTIQTLSNYLCETRLKKVYKALNIMSQVTEKQTIKEEVFTNKQIAHFISKNDTTAYVASANSTDDLEGWNIAIIGLAGQYPCSEDVEALWENLKKGTDCITEIPKERWDHSKYYSADKAACNKTYAKWGGFLKDMDCFDPLFFHISPLEAESMDPQERLFLQCVYHAIQDAGYTADNLTQREYFGVKNNVGVYVGVMYEEYQMYGAQSQEKGHIYSLNGSEASIANRVSYTFSFHGPSMSVDTMCSSSLTALYLACKSIIYHECEVAIAGGVNLSLHPNKFIMLGQSRFAAEDGRCRTFGENGSGYVPGEGVGVVILKPLKDAIEDGDHIYGIIKGAALNHGGKSGGYTVPNPAAQTSVILNAWEQAKIDPKTISYIEAHGTGTSLGDPIEIAALNHAFEGKVDCKQFCNIGSIKSNIGHCESAAGIAGLTKILLQMKYGYIVPSLHSQILNEKIDFANSPFIVPQNLTEWNRPKFYNNGNYITYPRIAGLSAFGAGGSNAHIIIEEYIPKKCEINKGAFNQIPLIAISAKSDNQIREQAQNLCEWLRFNSHVNIYDIAYTLLVGREAMERRIMILVDTLDELQNKLELVAKGDFTSVFHTSIANSERIFEVFDSDDEMKELLKKWMKNGKYTKLAEAWVNGLNIPWDSILNKTDFRRLSLPGYPFLKEHYFAPKNENSEILEVKNKEKDFLHPLIQSNTSGFDGQRYTSTFYGTETFFSEHIVAGQKMLPAVVFLEMVYEGLIDALHISNDITLNVEYKDVVWIRACIVEKKPIKVHVKYQIENEDKIRFEIYGDDNTEERYTFCTGTILLNIINERETYNLEELKQNNKMASIDDERIYHYFETIGLQYGPKQRAIKKLYHGESSVLAELQIPDVIGKQMDVYTINPAMLDSAIQACVGFANEFSIFNNTENFNIKVEELSIPFAVETVTIFSTCHEHMWAYLRVNKKKQKKFDVSIDLCDELGNVCISLEHIMFRKNKIKSSSKHIVTFQPVKEQLIEMKEDLQNYDRRELILCNIPEKIKCEICLLKSWDQICDINEEQKDTEPVFSKLANRLYNILRQKVIEKQDMTLFIQIAVPSDNDWSLLKGLTGLLKTVHLEKPQISCQLITFSLKENPSSIKTYIKQAAYFSKESMVICENGKCFGERLKKITLSNDNRTSLFQDSMVYLITGGLGQLGRIIAKEIAINTKNSIVFLTGRSQMTEKRSKQLEELRNLRIICEYQKIDISNQFEVEKLISYIITKYHKLDGIIHCAGVTNDSLIYKKESSDFMKTLNPKVSGTWNLDIATKEMNLKFFLLFSSISSIVGNIGQADYATGNAFMDYFSEYRNQLVNIGSRKGITISYNWPYWEAGGMKLNTSVIEAMQEQYGLDSLETENALNILYAAYSQKIEQVIVTQGNEQKITAMFEKKMPRVEKLPQIKRNLLCEGQIFTEEQMMKEVTNYLIQVFSETLKIPGNKISTDSYFDTYGVDSILTIRITEQLEKVFGTLSKTLLYEYQTIHQLADYFLVNHREALNNIFQKTETEKLENINVKEHIPQILLKQNMYQHNKPENKFIDKSNTDIAIIGIAGKYPQAQNITEYWENLCVGKDCITEIPMERWDYHDYFSDDKTKIGKTYSKWGGFLDDFDTFDPMFFHIPPAEAKFLDPQERLFIQSVWEALEDAGYTRKALKKEKVGVFVGSMYSLYQLYQMQVPDGILVGSSSYASIANRISYLFDFNGPSITLDTMCSSSLTAIYLACENIRSGATTMAVAGGVNLSIHPQKYIQLCQSGFLSTDGKCKSFGIGGDGYVPGEGVGAVLLKTLDRAVEDKDHIYGVIKGIEINAGGKVSGYTVPNQNAQKNLILDTLAQANIDPRTISYVEAHGTGTALGDPIEINAITQSYRKYTNDCQYCSIGSVKSNIGHLESAAGIAALTKVLLQMKYKKLVPSLHSKQVNPYIKFEETPFYVQQNFEEWEQPVIDGMKYPRRAAISAFGAGGSNAHMIIEEYVKSEKAKSESEGKQQFFLLSASDKQQLKIYAQKLYDFIYMLSGETYVSDFNSARDIKSLKDILQEILNINLEPFDDTEEFENFGMDVYQYEKFRTAICERTGYYISTAEMMQCKNLLEIWEVLNNDFKEHQNQTRIPLEDIAYTLQVGREAMEERLVVFASSYHDLLRGLELFLKDKSADYYFRNTNISDNEEYFHKIFDNEYVKNHLIDLIQKGNQKELAEYWLLGAQIDWEEFYNGNKKNRISLPTYPFKREHYLLQMGTVMPLQQERVYSKQLDTGEKKGLVYNKNKGVDQASNFYDKQDSASDTELEIVVEDLLKRIFEKVLDIPYQSISSVKDYEAYGIDSIHIKNINRYLEKIFGKLPSTLLFTYKTIGLLAKYFIKERKEIVLRILKTNVNITEGIIHEEKRINENKSKESKTPINTGPIHNASDIAIIGISGKFPKANRLDEYLKNLESGRDCISEIPSNRWDYKEFPEIKCKWGGFLEDIEDFDPQFFSISPANAVFMDPQERLLVQEVWKCLEDAGYTPISMEQDNPNDTRAKVAVYTGVTFNEYGLFGATDIARGKMLPINSQIYSIANRISYLFNFGGPSLSVDTACSSSLYAVYLGCESILKGECEMAIAGGVNLSLHPSKYITLNWAKFLASDGHCHSFGDSGDGYVPGEGVGAVLLKPLWKAEQDRDHIYGIIKGAAVNHGGKTYGYSVPNPVAQSDVIEKALQKGGIDAKTISYVEAHGTGTSLGDPIEISALSEAYRKYTNEKQYCAIGSVKANIGHLEAAAGISQLIKVLLQMQEKKIFQSRLNSDRLNPNIDFEDSPFYVQQKTTEWKRPIAEDGSEITRRAAISAFGVGGVNVHMIIEEYEDNNREYLDTNNEEVYIPISAKSEKALKNYVKIWIEFIDQHTNSDRPLYNIHDVAYTMQTGRIELNYRVAFIVKNFAELKKLMLLYLDSKANENIFCGKVLESYDKTVDNEKIQETNPVRNAANQWVTIGVKESEGKEKYGNKVSLPSYPFEKEHYWLYSKETRILKNEKEVNSKVMSTAILEQLKNAFEDDRLGLVTQRIQDIFAEILCFTDGKKPDIEEGFFSMGLESVASRQAQLILEEEFHLELNEQVFFNYPSIMKISEYILSLIDFDSQEKINVENEKESGEGLIFEPKWISTVSLEKAGLIDNSKYLFIGMDKELTTTILSMKDYIDKQNLRFISWGENIIQVLSKMTEYPDYIVFYIEIGYSNKQNIHDIDEKVVKVFETMKYITNHNKRKCSILCVYPHDQTLAFAEYSALGGFFKSLHLENSLVSFKMVQIEPNEFKNISVGKLIIQELQEKCNGEEIAYFKGKRYEKRLFEIVEESNAPSIYRERGVYLITGGFGGTASIIAQYLARTYHANLILTSRRNLGKNEIIKLKEIEKAGGKAIYIKADISNQEDVTALVDKSIEHFGHINGVLHTAGIIKDAMLSNKDIQDIKQVLMPKVYGTRYLDEALKDTELDFFVMFSSLSSVIGNIGQTDYCYANSFMDEFAAIRNQLRKKDLRSGKTYSINWSFWENGGMKIDTGTQKWMDKKLGLLLMDEDRGISILERVLKTNSSQVVVMNGRAKKIRGVFQGKDEEFNNTITLEEATTRLETSKEFNTENLLLQEELPSKYKEMDENSLLQTLGSILKEI